MAGVKHLLQKLLRLKNKEKLSSAPASGCPSSVHDAAVTAVSSPSSGNGDSDALGMVFARYDANGDGRISLSELEAVVRDVGSLLGNSDDPEAEAAAMMAAADLDGDGFISFYEFTRLMTTSGNRAAPGSHLYDASCSQWCSSSDESEEDLRLAFAVYDRNGDGVITAEELHCVLRRVMGQNGKNDIGLAPSISDCRRMIAAVDKDGDCAVSFQEFAAMMSATAVCCC